MKSDKFTLVVSWFQFLETEMQSFKSLFRGYRMFFQYKKKIVTCAQLQASECLGFRSTTEWFELPRASRDVRARARWVAPVQRGRTRRHLARGVRRCALGTVVKRRAAPPASPSCLTLDMISYTIQKRARARTSAELCRLTYRIGYPLLRTLCT